VATNIYFDNFKNTAEQSLIEDLVIESIKIYGHDVYYCPREYKDIDNTYNEDARSEYNEAYYVEMYIRNVEGFEGEGDFLSKFNIQIRDEITFTIANKRYVETIGDNVDSTRPREGDLIYMPLTKKVYVIKFVEHEAVFYQMGSLQTFDVRCELFEYSNERLNTGVTEIDQLEEDYSLALTTDDGIQRDANGNIIIDENTGRPTGVSDDVDINDSFDQNNQFELNADSFIDFTEDNPFSEGNY